MSSTLSRFVSRRLAMWLGGLLHAYESEICAKSLPKFPGNPKKLVIERPYRVINPEHMYFGDDVNLGPGSLLLASTVYPPDTWCRAAGLEAQQHYSPRITIGDRVSSTNGLTIGATCEVTIESDVILAGNVNIVDAFHGFSNTELPYKYQPMMNIKPILIGKGSWLGQNVVVTPGVTIGAMSIVGAGSVVRESIPEYSIAVGAPARVIRRWDENRGEWVPADRS